MQSRQQIINLLNVSKKKGHAIRVKITHEATPFLARVEDVLEMREIVKFNFENLRSTPTQRTSYYIDEIESLGSVGFSLNGQFSALQSLKENLQKILE